MTKFLMAALLALVAAAPAMGQRDTIYGLTTQNGISVFNSDAPNVSIAGGFVGGDLVAGEFLLGIDFRPSTGELFAFGSRDNFYSIDVESFEATLINNLNDSSGGPRLSGNSYAFDFNPAFSGGEFARIISNTDSNRVVSGTTGEYLGAVERTDVFYNFGDTNEGLDPNIAGIAYDNNTANSTGTQQFGIDQNLGVLVTVANNAGTLDTIGSLRVSPITNELGFDISGRTGIAYASLQNGPNSQLFEIDLTTGEAAAVGQIASGDIIRDITVVPVGSFAAGSGTAVPEPSSAGVLVLVGLTYLSRRRRS